jgi:uncharacterized membrane protein YbhN (UPF0104 family)
MAVIAGLFAWAIVTLYGKLQKYEMAEILGAIQGISLQRIFWAGVLTLLSYWLLTSYDVLAMRYIKKRMAYWRTAFISFSAYVLSNNVGLSLVGHTTLRYRFYSRWGISLPDIFRIVVFGALTFPLGLVGLAGISFTCGSVTAPDGYDLGMLSMKAVGFLCLAVIGIYLGLCACLHKPFRLLKWQAPLPSFRLALCQILISSLDVLLAASVLFVLLPSGSIGYLHFLGIYLLALSIGIVSHVPGCLGIFETIFIMQLPAQISPDTAFGALVVYRLIYYLLPLLVTLALWGGFEIKEHWGFFSWLIERARASKMPEVSKIDAPRSRLNSPATFPS